MKTKAIHLDNDLGPPYAYYHISRVYEDNSFATVAYIFVETDVLPIAELISKQHAVPLIDRRGITNGRVLGKKKGD